MLLRLINALCTLAGINTPAETQQLVNGLRADLEASNGLLAQLATQVNAQAKAAQNTAAVVRGVLMTQQAYEQASKPLMQAKRRLNAKLERARKKEAELAKIEPAAEPNPGGDATAAPDEPVEVPA